VIFSLKATIKKVVKDIMTLTLRVQILHRHCHVMSEWNRFHQGRWSMAHDGAPAERSLFNINGK
jgi:hypothetical protein